MEGQEAERLKDHIVSLERERNMLKTQVGLQEDEKNQAEEMVQILQKKGNDLQDEIAELSKMLEQLKHDSTRSLLEDLNKEIAEKNEEIREYHHIIYKLEENTGAMQVENDNLRN